MNVGKYYVAGIPFDSENSLKHYGVKGMEWDKHKFGLDADTRFIKWIDPNKLNVGSYGKYGKMAEAAAKQKYGAAAPTPRGRLAPVYNKQSVMNSRDSARRNMAQPWGRAVVSKEARDSQKRQREAFYNQNMQEALKQKAAADRRLLEDRNGTQQKRNNSPIEKASNFVTGTANRAGKAIGTAANAVGNWAGQQARNVGGAVSGAAQDVSKWTGQQAQNVGNWIGDRAHDVGGAASNAVQNVGNAVGQAAQNVGNAVGDWAKGAAQKAADVALWPATREGVANAARNVGNAVSGAAQNVGNTVGDLARNANNFIDQNITGNSDRARAEGYQKIADDFGNEQYAQKAQNAQEQADNSLFGRIGNAANAVGNWFGDRAQDVSQTAQNVGNWVGDRVQDVGNAVNPVAQNVSNAVGQAAQNVSNTVSDAANKASEGAKGFLNSAGQWVSGAANNVKNTASKATSDASKGATGFLNSAGKWVSNATGNVGKAAKDAGKAVSNAAQNVGNTVGQAAEQARGGIGGLFDRVGNAVGSAANSVGDWAGNAAKDVGNAVGGAANAVGDWAGQAVQDVGGAVQNAGNWVGEQARNAGGAVTGAAQNVGNFIDQNITGNSARADAQKFREYARQTDDRNGDWDLDANGQRTFPNDGSLNANTQYWANKSAEAQQNADNSLFGRAANAAEYLTGNNARNAVRDAQDNWNANVGSRLDDVNRYMDMSREFQDNYPWMNGPNFYDEQAARYQRLADQAGQTYGPVLDKAEKAYGRTLPGAIGNAARNVGNAISGTAGNVGNAVSGAAGNAVDWAQNAAGNVGNWAGQAAQNVGNAASNVADWARNASGQVGDWVGQAAQGVGNFANREFVQPFADLARAYGLDRMDETSGWYGRATQGPPLVPAAINWVRNNNPFVRHDALNEKPEGVSDAFWEKFTADGGTREEYERDWR